MSTFLTDLELEQLTGKKQPAAQRRALERVGIHYIPRADLNGRPSGSKADARKPITHLNGWGSFRPGVQYFGGGLRVSGRDPGSGGRDIGQAHTRPSQPPANRSFAPRASMRSR